MNLNALGILHVECYQLYKKLNEYFKQYYIFFPDDFYKAFVYFMNTVNQKGLLKHSIKYFGADKYLTEGDDSQFIKDINELIEASNVSLINSQNLFHRKIKSLFN